MAPPKIEELFYNDRCRGSGVLLWVYVPFGLLLVLARIVIGLQAYLLACILPKRTTLRSVVLRALCTLLGVVVKVNGMRHVDGKVKVIVANYTSTLDHLAVDLILPSVLPSVWDLPTILMWMLGYTEMGAKKGRDILIRNAKRHVTRSKLPLLAFPEGASTNGKVGLLKFSVWPFSLDQPVQPVVIKTSRSLFSDISPSILGGRWWIDLFWFLFVPYTVFHIRVLPPMSAEGDDDCERFAERVQKRIAHKLAVTATTYTSADKVDYAKRRLFCPEQRPGPAARDDVDRMVQNVLEVLPHVAADVIRRDLALTKDVDLTITNILEGRLDESEAPDSAKVKVTQLKSTSKISCVVPANTLKQNLQQCQLSFTERKRQMLEAARKRYVEKHGGVM